MLCLPLISYVGSQCSIYFRNNFKNRLILQNKVSLNPQNIGSFYVSGKLLTYPSPKPTFCPE